MSNKAFRFSQWIAQRRQSLLAKPRRPRQAASAWTGLEPLEDRKMLSAGPTITSVTVAPAFIVRGNTATFTATGIIDLSADIKSVQFYLDTNGDAVFNRGDTFLGAGKPVPGTSDYSLTRNTKPFHVGTETVFAVATDTNKTRSPLVSGKATIISHPPSLSKVTLAKNDAVAAGNHITLKALGVVGHDQMLISKVDFYYDSNNDGVLTTATDTKLGTDTNSSGGWTLDLNLPTTLATTGNARFMAVVTDVDGQVSATRSVTAPLDAPPTITSIVAAPTTAALGTSVTLTTSGAADTDGTIKRVSFFYDADGNGVLGVGDTALGAGTLTGTEYHITTTIPTGISTNTPARFFAVPVDNKGAVGVPVSVQVTLTPSIASVTASSPTIALGSPLTLTATGVVVASGATVQNVEFYLDSNKNGVLDLANDLDIGAGTLSGANYQLIYTLPASTPSGADRFFAVVKDSSNVTSSPASVAVTVTPRVGTLSTDISSVARGSNVTFTASGIVVTTGKTIAGVQFFFDANKNGAFDAATDTSIGAGSLILNTFNYQFTYTVPQTTTAGNYTFFAVVTDSDGNKSIAASVQIAVT